MRRRFALVVLGLATPLLVAGDFPEIAPLGADFRVHEFTPDEQTRPDVAMRSDGSFVVVWRSYEQFGDEGDIAARRFDSFGDPVAGEFRVNAYTPYNQSEPAVALQPGGGFVVVWTSVAQDGTPSGIFGRRVSSDGTPQATDFQINTYTTFLAGQRAGQVSSDADGDFVVVWESGFQGVDDAAVARLYASDGSPVTGELVVSAYTTSGRQGEPAVAMHPDGSFVVVWTSRRPDTGDSFEVAARRYDSSGSPVTGELLVNTATAFQQNQPAIAHSPAGGFLVTWSGFVSGDDLAGIFARPLDASGTPVASAFAVNSYTPERQEFPAVAAFDGGGFFVTWESQDQDGDERGIYGRFLDGSLAFVGDELAVNSSTVDSQRRPDVAATDEGSAVVVFEDGIDTNDPDVRARLYGTLSVIFRADFEENDFSEWDDVVP